MNQKSLIDSLKKALKLKGITHRKLAEMLEVSEITVSRMFSGDSLTMNRFFKICELIEVPPDELFGIGKESKLIDMTTEQEMFLVKNSAHWAFLTLLPIYKAPEKIAEIYNLNKRTVTGILAELDRLNFIQWHPGDKVKLHQRFRPIMEKPLFKEYFLKQKTSFLQGDFTGANNFHSFDTTIVSDNVHAHMKSRLKELAEEIKVMRGMTDLMKDDLHIVGVHLGIRDFEPPYVKELLNFEIK